MFLPGGDNQARILYSVINSTQELFTTEEVLYVNKRTSGPIHV